MAEPACPRCRSILERSSTGGVVAAVCASCHGAWMALDAGGSAAALHVCVLKLNAAEASRIRCPVCSANLEARHAGPLELNVCAAHGVWFDRDEVARALPLLDRPSTSVAIPGAGAARALIPPAAPGGPASAEPHAWIEGFLLLGEILIRLL